MLDTREVGVSHCLGVGGRDLSAAVAGRSTKAALALLDEDPATELIVLVSKPPDPAVAADVTAYAESLSTPVLIALLGPGRDDLTTVARRAVERLGVEWTDPWSWDQQPAPAPGGSLRGLFAGGTLCDEAMLIASETLGRGAVQHPAASRVGGRRRPALPRPPDGRLRRRRAHPGAGPPDDRPAHPDRPDCRGGSGPDLLGAAARRGARPRAPTPTRRPSWHRRSQRRGPARPRTAASWPWWSRCAPPNDDPQDPRRQAELLHEAGASVWLSNAAAARHAVPPGGPRDRSATAPGNGASVSHRSTWGAA